MVATVMYKFPLLSFDTPSLSAPPDNPLLLGEGEFESSTKIKPECDFFWLICVLITGNYILVSPDTLTPLLQITPFPLL